MKRKNLHGTVTSVPAVATDRIPTGIESLDDAISGGIPRGTMSVIAGKSNGGKSTIASQFVVEAQDLGHTVLWYSGESSDGITKEKFMRQTAGARYIYAAPDPLTNLDSYFLMDDIEEIIDSYYKDKVFLFSPEYCSDADRFLAQFEEELDATGADVLVVDNVMSLAATMGGNDLFNTQRKIAHYFADLVTRRSIWCVVCAHISVKQNATRSVGQGATSGAHEISSSAFLVLTIGLDKNERTNRIILDKIRDEVGGKVPKGTQIPIFYDQRAMWTYSYAPIDAKGCVPGGWSLDKIREHSEEKYKNNPPSMKWEEYLYFDYFPRKYPDVEVPVPPNVIYGSIKRKLHSGAKQQVVERPPYVFTERTVEAIRSRKEVAPDAV